MTNPPDLIGAPIKPSHTSKGEILKQMRDEVNGENWES
jgi:hypothetical protein